jgi:hypothetical protein
MQTFVVSLSLIVMGRFLVSSWGSAEFLRYVIFVNFTVGCGIFVAQIFYYMTSFSYKYLEDPVSGGMGILSALVVTIKQRLPDVSWRACIEECLFVCVCVCVCVCLRACARAYACGRAGR